MTNLLSESLVGLFFRLDGQRVIGFFQAPLNLIKCELDCAIFLFDDWASQAGCLGRFLVIHAIKD